VYTETFQQYKSKLEKGKASSAENQETQKESRPRQNGQNKGGKKRGRRNIKDSIQLMGETLVNTGKVVPLSAVFQTLSQVNQ